MYFTCKNKIWKITDLLTVERVTILFTQVRLQILKFLWHIRNYFLQHIVNIIIKVLFQLPFSLSAATVLCDVFFILLPD